MRSLVSPTNTIVIPGRIGNNASFDYYRNAREGCKLLYPLSRGDVSMAQFDACNNNSGGQISFTFPITTDATGIITSNITFQNGFEFLGVYLLYVGSTAYYIYTLLNPSTGNPTRYLYQVAGNVIGVAQSASVGTNATVSVYCVRHGPPILGAIMIQGGTANAGQTFHLEYVVHVEYTGVGVQGRTTVNPSDPHADAALAAVSHAREYNGKAEHGNVQDFIRHAAAEACTHHGQKVIDGIVDAVAPTGTGGYIKPVLNQGLTLLGKRLRR